MSGRLRRSDIRWESSSEEDETYDPKYKIRLRESLRNTQQSGTIENETVMEPRRRGRGPSKRPCLNRNALMARENRLKKKAYLEKIENKLSFYQKENKNLVNIIKKQSIDIKRLNGEVAYLKSVLNNNTNITALLKTINNGLSKINAQKKNSSHPNHISELCSGKAHVQHNHIKENILNSQNTNIFITNVNDTLAKHNTTKNEVNELHINSKRPFTCKDDSNISKISSPVLDSDHTYTISKNPTVDAKNNSQNAEVTNAITNSISEPGYIDDVRDMDNLLPIAQTDLSVVEEKKDNTDTTGIDFDQLSTFNMDIFEDLPKYDEFMNTVDNLNDTSDFFTEEEISQTLDNTGICLHVNSDKVSLEFCSVCHLNSKNSGLN